MADHAGERRRDAAADWHKRRDGCHHGRHGPRPRRDPPRDAGTATRGARAPPFVVQHGLAVRQVVAAVIELAALVEVVMRVAVVVMVVPVAVLLFPRQNHGCGGRRARARARRR
jgi:hypothetical protein